MTSTFDRAVRGYRLDRLRVAALGALPSIGYVLAASLLGATETTFLLGASQLVVCAVFLYLGGAFARGVGIGTLLGIVPFATASIAQGAGHLCLDGACMSVCAPACTAAGVVTGIAGSVLTVRVHGGLRAFVAMATVVTLAGAMGCRCLGYGSLLGLVSGLLVSSIPAMPRLIADSRA